MITEVGISKCLVLGAKESVPRKWKCTCHLLLGKSVTEGLESPLYFSSVQFNRSVVSNSLQPYVSQHASLSITISRSSLKLMSIESVMSSSHLILCCPLVLLSPIPPSIRAFSNESTLPMKWPKYWSFSFSISPSNEHPGLTSFRMDWLDLLAVQWTLKSPLESAKMLDGNVPESKCKDTCHL